jgi:hypothetical protein
VSRAEQLAHLRTISVERAPVSGAIKHRIARRRAEEEEAEAFFPPRATTK